MSSDHFVRFENVDKSYDGKQLVVKGLNLDIEEGEFVTKFTKALENVNKRVSK